MLFCVSSLVSQLLDQQLHTPRMKKVLVLNGDSYVGLHVVKAFYRSYEYEVEITRTSSDGKAAATAREALDATSSERLWSRMKDIWDTLETSSKATVSDPRVAFTSGSYAKGEKRVTSDADVTESPTSPPGAAGLSAEERNSLPADIRLCVSGIVPKHNDNTEEFRERLLANDVIIAVLQDDTYEAMCAIRILAGTHYDVEKTFVLVSSAVTWAYTLTSERARARATQRKEREEEREAFLEELLDAEDEEDDDGDGLGGGGAAALAEREARRASRRAELEQRLPFSLREPAPGEDEMEIRELVPDRVFTDDAYAQRVPHPRFQHWHSLEQLVKRSNTETLHTYVIFAGLPYGAGEGSDMLLGLLRSAWHHQALLQYGAGVNRIPMIHVQDLAAVLYKVGSAYDVLDERYMFAVDQGHTTQRQLLQAVQARLGGSVQPAVAVPPSGSTALAVDLVRLDQLELPPPTSAEDLFAAFGNEPCWGGGGTLLNALVLSDIEAETTTALTVHAEEEWVALDGFLAALDLTCAQFRAAHAEAFKPVRALITGPPLSGAGSVAALVAQRRRAPCVSRKSIVLDYKAHVADVRAALRGLLIRRLQRRRDRVQARLVRQAAQEKVAQRLAKEQQRRQEQEERQERGKDDDSGSSDGESVTQGTASEDGGASDEASLMSIFLRPATAKKDARNDDGEQSSEDDEEEEDEEDAAQQHHQRLLRPIKLVVNEAYIRGAADNDVDDDDEEGGIGIDEELEEGDADDGEEGNNWLEQLDAQDEEMQAELQDDRELLSPVSATAAATHGVATTPSSGMPRFAARRRGRTFARDVDQQELRCIAALRQEYLLGLKVLALKVSNEGRLPRPPPTPQESETSEGDDGYDGKGGHAGKGDESDEDSAEEGEEESEDGDEEEETSDRTADASREVKDGDAEEEEEEEEGTDGESPETGDDTNSLFAIDPSDDGSAYLDCALAFMFRWRLRQPDCRCQGYVLKNFPQTLAQAVLCFRTNENELEDGELRRQRALAPLLARANDHAGEDDGNEDEELPAPIDADFPLPDIAEMGEEELAALEWAHCCSRGPTPGRGTVGAGTGSDGENLWGVSMASAAGVDDAETVMAPVDESLFVDHVFEIQADPAALRVTMDALQTTLDVAESQMSPSTLLDGVASSAHGAAAIGSTESALAALHASLHAVPYDAQLQWYMDHHDTTAPPSKSLLAWLSAVTTTPALGVRSERVIVPPSTLDGFTDGGGFGDDAHTVRGASSDGTDAAIATMEGPPTTRTAQIHVMPAPLLNTEEVKESWCAEREQEARECARAKTAGVAKHTVESCACADECGSALVAAKLPVALMRLAPLYWSSAAAPHSPLLLNPVSSLSAHTPHPRDSGTMVRCTPASVPSLVALAEEVWARIAPAASTTAPARLEALLIPNSVTVAREETASPPAPDTALGSQAGVASLSGTPADEAPNGATDSTSDAAAAAAAAAEREAKFASAFEEEASQILRESVSLCRLQLVEGSADTATMLQLPAETYLMKYVIPNLTPAMTDVVRMRPNDPVSTLADILFDCHRRVTL
ncbi:hypothetical protein JKF63_03374 [Porcisia hertigi]|uniref:Uncharacterized protein n=1 Tax=Porcisia hertigi TaxID=2761500 RepID=A0A836LAU1_9TRYP|nr:hypothetical protein JKF63_03374 [Porcisia hertigi]